MVAKRVVVAGLGDTGLLSAVRLTGHADVVGVSAKATWVSPRELGTRISRPDEWARDYLIAFDRFRALTGPGSSTACSRAWTWPASG